MGTGPHSTSYSPKFERLRTKRRPGTPIVAIPAHRFKPAIRGAGGGAPWTRFNRDGDEWAAQIDTTLVPHGLHKLSVLTDSKRASALVNVTVQNTLKVFFADLHVHVCG
jgi:hypothetical protein